MIEIKGKYESAKIFTENVEDLVIGQLMNYLNLPFSEGSNMRIMPDVHYGAGVSIGTTLKVTDKIVPNLVGKDIGCGMLTVEIAPTDIDFAKLDAVIHAHVPAGQNIRTTPHRFLKHVEIDKLIAPQDEKRATLSLGSVGSGNHFIELNQAEDGRIFIVIHSGSRHVGTKVASYHQKQAIMQLTDARGQIDTLIADLKSQGRALEIQEQIKKFKAKQPSIPAELAYLEGDKMQDYLHDLRIAQKYALYNRYAMMDEILTHMGFKELGRLDTIHNYVDLDYNILRKGAISARLGEDVLIPINMRDGSILARGKGNDDWNQSAPHGAGRIMSRSKAKEFVNLADFEETMQGVYSTSVCETTVDEAPSVYKTMDEIIANTQDTIEVLAILKPLYNFKSK